MSIFLSIIYLLCSFFINHIIVLGIVFAYTFVMSYGLYWLTDKVIPMRVSGWNERVGLDSSQHGEEYGNEAALELPSDSDWFRGVEEN